MSLSDAARQAVEARQALAEAKMELERALVEWSRADAARDDLVFAAHDAGISKRRIFERTGIARTTIDRIVARQQAEPRSDIYMDVG